MAPAEASVTDIAPVVPKPKVKRARKAAPAPAPAPESSESATESSEAGAESPAAPSGYRPFSAPADVEGGHGQDAGGDQKD
jgi:hypothetical protein